ncbi:MAG: cell division protein ZapB [Desulfobacteraceae bacterium]|nr:cell division protein ZapB [Desulfobacteraceae bacterium]MBU4000862.1 cell division protein ZapB [Pseudomonadota bacterium]MBU4053789.1 cell division protein ZapB [Pseudomonadota bacterium]
MDNQSIFKQFEELENKLGNLIGFCKSYEKENIELKEKINGLEEELQGKVTAENQLRQEREMIRSKIDGLINRFHEIEVE